MANATQVVNPNADVLKSGQAQLMNINAARGLQDVLKSNLGPKGTLKMLVGGAGDIKLTKDGNTLLHEMQMTACLGAKRSRDNRKLCAQKRMRWIGQRTTGTRQGYGT